MVWCLAGSAVAHGATAAIGEIDVRAEIAAALFAASATQAAAERMADAKIRSQRKEIEELRGKVRAGDVQRKADLTAACASANPRWVASSEQMHRHRL